MVDTSLLLHANLLYAEFPFSEIPNVVDKSYLPVLEMLESNPQYKVILNWTGFTLEVLEGKFPEYGKTFAVSVKANAFVVQDLEIP